ncbi:MAG: hypothetical protein GF411_03170 [Candidatus Lokiarchaeota archaeon]|nr:hypothetical protein [Candidatus Lokiarchaeota archaeon]
MDIQFNFNGLDNMLGTLDELSKGVSDEILDRLERVGRIVQSEAVKRCPVDTGFLAGSAYYGLGTSSKKPSVEIGFNASYAVYVHEVKKRYTGVDESRFGKAGNDWKGWKYLERAIEDNLDKIRSILYD